MRRAYEDPAQDDGTRVLVDRIWPRGLTEARAALDDWCKEIAPSAELRKWYGQEAGDPACWAHRVCPECGRLNQAEHPDACEACGATSSAD